MSTPEMIDLLIDLDMQSFVQSVNAKDTSIIRMMSGAAPTARQLELIMQAGVEDINAASAELRARAVRAQNAVFPPTRLLQLMHKYGAGDDEHLDAVMPRMSPEDQDEARSLIGWLAEDERSDHGNHGA